MITTDQPYKLLEDNLVAVCMFCYKGRSIFEAFPALRGREVSHGICKAHMAEQLKMLASIRRNLFFSDRDREIVGEPRS